MRRVYNLKLICKYLVHHNSSLYKGITLNHYYIYTNESVPEVLYLSQLLATRNCYEGVN